MHLTFPRVSTKRISYHGHAVCATVEYWPCLCVPLLFLINEALTRMRLVAVQHKSMRLERLLVCVWLQCSIFLLPIMVAYEAYQGHIKPRLVHIKPRLVQNSHDFAKRCP